MEINVMLLSFNMESFDCVTTCTKKRYTIYNNNKQFIYDYLIIIYKKKSHLTPVINNKKY